jgi:alkanesulfonate monooxygenase SsuD/methylene tetrahydromethanopterin reductase-like flavin-dependent oxidoreductase (luciferase family)
MKFGVFDHLDLSTPSISEHYENRLRLVEAYDRIGLHGYFLAEHHFTPLGMGSSPSVFLSAVAQRTKRLRFGPMIYQLATRHPLHLLEEIGMLDQLSGGRLELGVGRGVNPVEHVYFQVPSNETRDIFHEALTVIRKGLTADVLSHDGKYFSFKNIAMVIRPLQRPHPPIWCGVHDVATARWAARNSIHIGSHLPPGPTRLTTDAYRTEWQQLGNDPATLSNMALTQHLIIADSDQEAKQIGRRVYQGWYDNFYYLHTRENIDPIFFYPKTYDELEAMGDAIAGSPATVRKVLSERMAAAGTNYLFCRFAYGAQTLAEMLRSVDLFARDVMPALMNEGTRAAAE